MATRLELIKEIGEEIAGRDRVGSIASGTATTAVLSGLVNVSDDENFAVGDLLQMPDAASVDDQERNVTEWDPTTGQATWTGNRSATYTDETFILQPRPAYTLNEMRRSINDCLSQLQRTYRMVLPAIPDTYEYVLDALPWLTSDGRVDDVVFCESPNQLHNEDYSLWHESSTPDGWTLAGGTVQKVSGGTWGPYAARLTRSGTDATLTQSLPSMLVQWLVRRTNANLTTLYRGAWVYCETPNIARIGISDGSSTTWSAYHGGSGLEWLTVSLPLTSSMRSLSAVSSVDTTNGSADFSGEALTIGGQKVPDPMKDRGSRAFLSYPIPFVPRNVGGVPVVDVKHTITQHAQLVVWSRRTFAELSADTDSTDADRETVISGAIMRMLEVQKPGQDRTRLDRVLAEHSTKYARLAANLVDVPVEAPQRSFHVGSA